MSLKAKIEAVIYASEEPVTLAQLVGLLGEEAQAELDREVAAQQTLLKEEELEAAEEEPVLGPDFDAAQFEESMAPAEAAPISDEPGEASEAEPTSQNRDAHSSEQVHLPGTPIVGNPAIQPTHDGEAVMNGAPDIATTPPEVAAADQAAAAKAEKARMARLRAHFRVVLDQLTAEYATGDHGLEIREVAGGFRFATKPEYHDAVRGFVKSLKPPLKLSLQALETLAVVAYKQPVTAPEISEIRGVDSGGVLGSLIARKLITTAGRKHVIGRPILYKTTKEFLLKFGLKDLAELPSIEEFEKMAGQMAEQEEIPMNEPVHTDYRVPVVPEQPERGDLETGSEVYAPHLEETTRADDVAPEDRASIDGRLSSLPPRYDDVEDDPSAAEAEIQSGE